MPTRARDGRHVLIAAIVLEVLAVWFVHWIDTRGYMDTEIYRLGARAWLNGYQVYGDDLTPETPDSATLPFIYPPFAALLFIPLTWLSETAAVVVVALCSHLAILVTAYSLARSSRHLAPHAGRVAVATALLLPWLTIIEPSRETLNYGQINLVLMGLVAADCLLPRTRWPRGMLVGIAAAIKLTPLGFLLLFLLRKDYRAMSITGVTFATTVFVGFLAAPRDSADWWLDKMLSTGDSFGTVYAGNLTLRSLLAKQELTGFALNSLWIGGSLLLLVLAIMGIRYALSVRDVPLALMINAVWVLLVSPISWSHHWVWAGPALALVFVMSLRNRWYGMTIAVVISAITVLAGPQWYLPNTGDRELDWTFSQQIVGNAYTLIGIGFLVCAAIACARFGRRPVNSPEFTSRSLIPGR
ncbi:glycosyltransferase 87 family protein [Saccharopolyspora sp. TS4A08]|uniref:Glycosyltransferase 87 family protein n=1 Tax=Saccharopolyspora ipomoeae TaxID=3042027 RepID=A0ABT6PW39_9PSEU|nr:glycosyltransferase 87 family protein [Saccharopolyspora sp. TS4A08]MDI2032055.1 glycosyltransferase 87 family protein [Saccharopolyspora sp. TS4A08]